MWACGVDARCRLPAATLLAEFVTLYPYPRVELRHHGTWLAKPTARALQQSLGRAWRLLLSRSSCTNIGDLAARSVGRRGRVVG
eukprot:5582228-Prymnesium_polylepis.1